jgi:hypothetical protein
MGKWQGVLLGGGALLVLAGASLILGAAGGASGQSPASVGFMPVTKQIDVGGDEFVVEVQAKGVQNLGAYEIALKFDTAKLEFTGVSGAGYLASTGRAESCVGTAPGVEGDPVKHANRTGYVTYGCNTNGLIQNGVGKLGPNGDGTLAYVSFKPKASGVSDLILVGYDGLYVIELDANGQIIEWGQTYLAAAEVCEPSCPDPIPSLPMTTGTGLVQIVDPDAGPTPTGVPPTATVVPARPTPNTRATVEAALGPPGRRLGDDSSTGTTGSGANGAGGAPSGNIGGEGTTPGSTGSTSRSGTTGTTAGTTARGPDGAPVAGHGPQDQRNPWPARAGLLLVMGGVFALTAGLAARRARVTR